MPKAKQSFNKPGQAKRFPIGRGSQLSRRSTYEDGKVVRPTHNGTHLFLEAVSTPGAIVRPEELWQ